MEQKTRLRLEFDGGCWPNPGGPMSYGWVLWNGAEAAQEGCGRVGGNDPATNNTAEWNALLAGLRFVQTLSPAALTIQGDSQLVIFALTGRWKARKPHLARLRDECLALLGEIGCDWRAQWVPREQNAAADALSRLGLKREAPSEFDRAAGSHLRSIVGLPVCF